MVEPKVAFACKSNQCLTPVDARPLREIQSDSTESAKTPGGNYTLIESQDGKDVDCKNALWGNTDREAFYKAVAQKMSEMLKAKLMFEYVDYR